MRIKVKDLVNVLDSDSQVQILLSDRTTVYDGSADSILSEYMDMYISAIYPGCKVKNLDLFLYVILSNIQD